MWRSLVARFVRDEEAAGSSPVIPTKCKRIVPEGTVLLCFRKGMADLNPWARPAERKSGGLSNRARSEAAEEDAEEAARERAVSPVIPTKCKRIVPEGTVLLCFRKGMADLNPLNYFLFTAPAQKQAMTSTKSM